MARTAAKKVIFKLPGEAAKAFTSKGQIPNGSEVSLPAAEAGRFVELGLAMEVRSAKKEA